MDWKTALDASEPTLPGNGALPAREVYREMRSHMIDAAPGKTVPDLVLASFPDAARYFPVQFTRTWERIDNTSVRFPGTDVEFEVDGNDVTSPAAGSVTCIVTPTGIQFRCGVSSCEPSPPMPS